MKNKHTSGPWFVSYNCGSVRTQKAIAFRRADAGPDELFIARVAKPSMADVDGCFPGECLVPSEVQAANARLIAAAPELLEIVKHLPWELMDLAPDHPLMQKVNEVLERLGESTPKAGPCNCQIAAEGRECSHQ